MKDHYSECDQSELPEQDSVSRPDDPVVTARRRMVILALLEEVAEAFAGPTVAIQEILRYLMYVNEELYDEFIAVNDSLTSIIGEKFADELVECRRLDALSALRQEPVHGHA